MVWQKKKVAKFENEVLRNVLVEINKSSVHRTEGWFQKLNGR